MDRLLSEDGRRPFVLSTTEIADLSHRAASCDHPVTGIVLAATLIPCDVQALARANVRSFDGRQDTITVQCPTGAPVKIALGHAAAAAIRNAVGGRTTGPIFADPHGEPIEPDEDTIGYADELLAMAGGTPLRFGWSFRSVREGVFAAMADGGVPQNVAEAQAGMARLPAGQFAEALHRVQQRAASDWWAASLGIPGPATIDVLRTYVAQLRWNDEATDASGGGRHTA